MDIALYHVATYKAGDGGYYQDLRPDHFEVWHDSKRYIYERPHYHGRPAYGAREARAFVSRAWDHCGDPRKVSGRWPSYSVD